MRKGARQRTNLRVSLSDSEEDIGRTAGVTLSEKGERALFTSDDSESLSPKGTTAAAAAAAENRAAEGGNAQEGNQTEN
jgi:hypothetical protein